MVSSLRKTPYRPRMAILGKCLWCLSVGLIAATAHMIHTYMYYANTFLEIIVDVECMLYKCLN